MANRQFVELGDRFVLLAENTNDGYSDFAKSYSLGNNCSGFILLDSHGEEISRIVSYSNKEFDETILATIDEAARKYIYSNRELVKFILTMQAPTPEQITSFGRALSNLASNDYKERDRATNEILGMGFPGFELISDAKVDNIEAKARAEDIVERMRPLHQMATHYGLDHNPEYLWSHAQEFPAVLDRLKAILPAEADFDDIGKWWQANSENYYWNASTNRYVQRKRDE